MTAQTIFRNYYLETQISGSRASRYGMFNLVCPFYNRETERGGGRTFKARGAKLWNWIPLDMRKKDTAGAFKNARKK